MFFKELTFLFLKIFDNRKLLVSSSHGRIRPLNQTANPIYQPENSGYYIWFYSALY